MKIVNRKAFWSTIIAVAVPFGLYTVGKVVITNTVESAIVQIFLREVLLFVLTLISAIVTKRLGCMKFKKEGFWTTLSILALMIFYPVFSISVNLFYGDIKPVTVGPGLIFMFVVTMILVGITEELLFRGILMNGMFEAFGEDSVSSVKKGIVISAVIFGMLHMFNLITGADFGGVFVQSVTAIPAAMLWGAAYYRGHKNIWPCVIVHSIEDTLSFIQGGLLAGASFASSVSGFSFLQYVVALIDLSIALFAMRKKKMQPLIDEKTK